MNIMLVNCALGSKSAIPIKELVSAVLFVLQNLEDEELVRVVLQVCEVQIARERLLSLWVNSDFILALICHIFIDKDGKLWRLLSSILLISSWSFLLFFNLSFLAFLF